MKIKKKIELCFQTLSNPCLNAYSKVEILLSSYSLKASHTKVKITYNHSIKVVADAIIQRSQNKLPPSTTRQSPGNDNQSTPKVFINLGGNSNHLKNYKFGDGSPGSCCKRFKIKLYIYILLLK